MSNRLKENYERRRLSNLKDATDERILKEVRAVIGEHRDLAVRYRKGEDHLIDTLCAILLARLPKRSRSTELKQLMLNHIEGLKIT